MLTLVSGPQQGMAQVLVAWDTQGLTGQLPDPWSATTLGPGLVATPALTRVGGTLLPSGANNANDTWGGYGGTQASAATAIAAGHFVSFGIEVAPLQQVFLESLSFNLYRQSNISENSFQWQYDAGQGFQNIGGVVAPPTGGSGTAYAADLTGIQNLQGLMPGDTVAFRLVVWGSTQNNQNHFWGFGKLDGDDLALTGTVKPLENGPLVIPEPGHAILFAVGGGWMVLKGFRGIGARRRPLRRRRRPSDNPLGVARDDRTEPDTGEPADSGWSPRMQEPCPAGLGFRWGGLDSLGLVTLATGGLLVAIAGLLHVHTKGLAEHGAETQDPLVPAIYDELGRVRSLPSSETEGAPMVSIQNGAEPWAEWGRLRIPFMGSAAWRLAGLEGIMSEQDFLSLERDVRSQRAEMDKLLREPSWLAADLLRLADRALAHTYSTVAGGLGVRS